MVWAWFYMLFPFAIYVYDIVVVTWLPMVLEWITSRERPLSDEYASERWWAHMYTLGGRCTLSLGPVLKGILLPLWRPIYRIKSSIWSHQKTGSIDWTITKTNMSLPLNTVPMYSDNNGKGEFVWRAIVIINRNISGSNWEYWASVVIV